MINYYNTTKTNAIKCKNINECPELFVNKWNVKNVKNIETATYEITDEVGGNEKLIDTEQQTYLGDIISSNAKNTANILSRKKKGYSIINQIKNILNEGFFGRHHFKAAVLLRQSLFVNSVLLNCEIWNNLTKKDIHLCGRALSVLSG